MTVDAVAYHAKHLANVREMLASSATFRARLPVASAAVALSRIYLGFRPYSDDELTVADLPLLVLAIGRDSWQKRAGGVGSTLFASGVFYLDFYVANRYDNQADAYYDAANVVFGTLADFAGFVGDNGNTDVQSIETAVELQYSGDSEAAPYWFYRSAISWGVP